MSRSHRKPIEPARRLSETIPDARASSGSHTASAPIIVSALFGASDHARLTALRTEHYPAERNRLDAHLTLFHHLPPSVAPELRARLGEAARARPPEAMITGIMDLGRGTAYAVSSPPLEDIRDALADAFDPLLIPQDRAPWRPHVTIQNKVEPMAARALQRSLSAGFKPRPLTISGLAA
ncbi:2'-5' RNA ligase family protein [Sphingomonas colocasiae]|uniref:2'-5' RNA ligase family protein n=1 Tax=Sphingomonas colocasiae TaxID=1848973 RepID=A0ABS7PPW9_9SPHN|nr:2'-5' RNA ligase family protein [Sphingomonas colocasiae]MBY8823039.1 2'-5' RNA ligase family protein [Sphingomonas colocasiae]